MNEKPTKEKKTTINEIVKHKTFATWLAIISMLVQSKHTFTAYLSSESLDPNYLDYFFSALAAGVFDLIILFYTLRGRISIARFGAIVLGVINVYAYWLVHEDWTLSFVFSTVFAVSMPALVFYYSDELIDGRTKRKEKSKVVPLKPE